MSDRVRVGARARNPHMITASWSQPEMLDQKHNIVPSAASMVAGQFKVLYERLQNIYDMKALLYKSHEVNRHAFIHEQDEWGEEGRRAARDAIPNELAALVATTEPAAQIKGYIDVRQINAFVDLVLENYSAEELSMSSENLPYCTVKGAFDKFVNGVFEDTPFDEMLQRCKQGTEEVAALLGNRTPVAREANALV